MLEIYCQAHICFDLSEVQIQYNWYYADYHYFPTDIIDAKLVKTGMTQKLCQNKNFCTIKNVLSEHFASQPLVDHAFLPSLFCFITGVCYNIYFSCRCTTDSVEGSNSTLKGSTNKVEKDKKKNDRLQDIQAFEMDAPSDMEMAELLSQYMEPKGKPVTVFLILTADQTAKC